MAPASLQQVRPPLRQRLRPRLRPIAIALAAACAWLAPACQVQAALMENLTTSVTAMALGNAVTADPPGVDSIHFNPAGLARIKEDREYHSSFGASIRTSATFKQGPGFDIGGWTEDPLNNTSTGPVRQGMYVPGYGKPGWRLPGVVIPGLGFAWHKEGSPFTFGTASYMSEAMSVDRTKDPNDPGRFDGKQVQIQRMVYASPSVGYQYSDTLRFGVSVPIAHAAFVVNTDMRMPNELLGIFGKLQQGWCPENGGNILDVFGFGLCGGGKEGMVNPFKKAANMQVQMTAPFDPTLNLGVLWEPKPWFAIGAVYQGGSKTRYSGTYAFHVEPMLRSFVQGLNSGLLGPIAGAVLGFPSSIPELQHGNMNATIAFPTHIQVGIKLKPVRYVQFNVDASYATWGDWNAFTFEFDQSIKLLEVARLYGIPDSTKLKIPRGYKSLVNFGYGIQLFPTDKLTLRFGLEPRKSSIPNDKLDLLAPLPNTKLWGVGVNYRFDSGTEISLTGSYMTGKFNVPANGSCNMNCYNFTNVIYNPYAAMDVAGDIHVRYVGFNLSKKF